MFGRKTRRQLINSISSEAAGVELGNILDVIGDTIRWDEVDDIRDSGLYRIEDGDDTATTPVNHGAFLLVTGYKTGIMQYLLSAGEIEARALTVSSGVWTVPETWVSMVAKPAGLTLPS